jgi:hypothetical protein
MHWPRGDRPETPHWWLFPFEKAFSVRSPAGQADPARFAAGPLPFRRTQHYGTRARRAAGDYGTDGVPTLQPDRALMHGAPGSSEDARVCAGQRA